MNSKSEVSRTPPVKRAEALVSYLEEKSAHLSEPADELQKQSLKKEIEKTLESAAEFLKNIEK